MLKFLIGGSPCTHWSIAQSKNRETTADGIGWELFKNYLIAKERFQPDFFLYENNKSAAQAIKDQIARELQAPLQYINSALVSAQNRQRFYVHNFGNVPEPADRGILLQDILEGGGTFGTNADGKAHCLDASYYKGSLPQDTLMRHKITLVAEQLSLFEPIADRDKAECFRASYDKAGRRNFEENIMRTKGYEGVTVRVGCLPNATGEIKNSQGKRIYAIDGKSVPLCACASSGGTSDASGNRTGLYAVPVRVGTWPDYQQQAGRIYAADGKSVTLKATDGGGGAATGLYACPLKAVDYKPLEGCDVVSTDQGLRCVYKETGLNAQGYHVQLPETKMRALLAGQSKEKVFVPYDPATDLKPVYRVEGGQIEIKGNLYPIKLPDGLYIIRKLSVTECCRLQTLPDDYCRAVSAAQAYKGLGNGWTAEVIMHLLSHALRGVPKDKEIVVLSMYDGIGTGRYCFDALGYTNVTYYAYEIDKYAKQISGSNYPDIIQCGDAFAVREARWFLAEEERRAAL